ncbi:hypothetical protein [Riemerella columbina]|uniref:hypothetical protein n=1 Tax=Riemerella columbina TaxID=103810 RepID=UPI0003772546|nr:hypothetical protein [Riemerella columbina]
MSKKRCLECGGEFVGRVDKKFCSDSCRNSYNNQRNKDQNNLMRNINNQLRKNYRILSGFNTTGKTKIPKTKLLEKGFVFSLFTSIIETQSGGTYYFVYDQGYLYIDDEWMLLVKKKGE